MCSVGKNSFTKHWHKQRKAYPIRALRERASRPPDGTTQTYVVGLCHPHGLKRTTGWMYAMSALAHVSAQNCISLLIAWMRTCTHQTAVFLLEQARIGLRGAIEDSNKACTLETAERRRLVPKSETDPCAQSNPSAAVRRRVRIFDTCWKVGPGWSPGVGRQDDAILRGE